jgi:Domain of unknown function (DUF4118)
MASRWVRPSVGRWLSGMLVSVAAVAAVSGLIALLDPHVPPLSLLVLYILAVLAVAIVWGTVLAAFTSILSTAVFAYLFTSPIRSVQLADWRELVARASSWPLGWWVSWRPGRAVRRWSRPACRRSSRRCGGSRPWSPRWGRRRRSSRPSPGEVGLLCDAELARMERYEQDGTVTGMGLQAPRHGCASARHRRRSARVPGRAA